MAVEKKVSIKHMQIDKSQSNTMIVIVVAVFVTIFCLFGTKALITKGMYQRRGINAKHKVVDTLKANYTSAQTLFTQYKVFADNEPNVLGGQKDGTGGQDGSNPKVTLDALPSTYDAPALATSLEKILTGRGATINSLKVTDDPTTYSDQAQPEPKAKSVTFSFEATSNFSNSALLLQDFERSIRPFDLNTLEIDGADNNLKLAAGMTTYYQPAKSLDLKANKEVK